MRTAALQFLVPAHLLFGLCSQSTEEILPDFLGERKPGYEVEECPDGQGEEHKPRRGS